MTSRTVRLTVNGRTYTRTVEPRTTLADFLRDDLDLTGTHVGCEHGVCGACTVLTTVEGLADGERLHPIQEAFREHHGLQCGFCTPGLLLTAKALLEENPAPTDREIREAIAGNLCRCTGYHFIVDAIRAAARGPQR